MAESVHRNTSQETKSQDPLLAIFGCGRLTDSTGSQCSQDEGPVSRHQNACQGPASNQYTEHSTYNKEPGSKLSTTNKLSDHLKAGVDQTRTRSNALCQSSKQDVESQNGSMDLFSHQSTEDSLMDIHIDITLQLTEFVWVQCDNPDCQKWRRIPASEAEDLGADPWYCYMSSDPDRNTCKAAEEDHAMYDRMAKKAGIKFVMSMLGVGSLVWAKMAGYCRWPAVITRDPEIGCHVLIDIDGDPYSYHVEFLGKSHSHSWVAAKSVEVYGHKAQPELEDSQSQSRTQTGKKHRKGHGRGRIKKITLTSQSVGKRRQSYRRMHIDAVIREADFLLCMEQDERLKYTIFKYDPLNQQKSEMKKEKKTGSQSSCEKCSQCKKKGRKRKDTSLGREQMDSQVLSSLKETSNVQSVKRKSQGAGRKKVKTGKENGTVYDCISDAATPSNCELSLDEGISVKTVKTEVSVFDSPDQFSQSRLKFMNPMMDKSKEEKFSIDIDMYKKNEAAFEHDVRRFMTRNGENIRSTPVWHTVPVRLFQLYLAVHERGGFQQVNKKKQWSAVYKELTEQQHVSCGAVAKKYYQNNLYLYELYITGKEYENVLKEHRKNSSKVRQKKKCQTPVPAERKGKSDISQALFKDDGTTLSQDIEAILDQLEEDYSPKAHHTVETTEKSGLRFHDDNTQSSTTANKVPSEFQNPSDVQEVPDGSYSGDGLSDIEEKILHEMKALEDDMKEIGDLD